MKTILRNLLTNALKFTNRNGWIIVEATTLGNEVKISIKDNGIGIKEEDLSILFQGDSNESTRGTKNEKGTGLGLILCHEFVNRHGGRIWAEKRNRHWNYFQFYAAFR